MTLVAGTIGCRGSLPFGGRTVQITKSSGSELKEIDAVPQRLATAKPRVDDEGLSASPHQSRPPAPDKVSASAAPTASQMTSVSAAAIPAAVGAESQSPNPKSIASATVASSPSATASATTAAPSSATTAAPSSTTSDKLPSASDTERDTKQAAADAKPGEGNLTTASLDANGKTDELLTLFQQFPSEVRQQVLRQYVAAVAQSADETNQPHPVNSELAKQINQLPTLPAPRSTAPQVSPTRLAENESAVATLSDTSDSITSPASDASVQAVSAERPASESTMVAHAVAGNSSDAVPATSGSGKASSEKASLANNPDEKATTDLNTEQELLAALIERLSSEPKDESDADRTSRLIKLRHAMVLAGDPDSAVSAVDGMAEAEQEFLRHHLLGLWSMIDPQGHPVPSRRFATAVPQIREAAKFAAAATDALEVRSLAFCTEIESYGQITSFPGNRFRPGQQVILYCEIENFTVERVETGYETHLLGSYDVFDAKNEKVFSQVLPADQQVSANFLRDYFIAYQMHLPEQLAPGTYRLQLTMEDVNGKKYGQSSIPLEIAK
jgi:hypothetical protein